MKPEIKQKTFYKKEVMFDVGGVSLRACSRWKSFS